MRTRRAAARTLSTVDAPRLPLACALALAWALAPAWALLAPAPARAQAQPQAAAEYAAKAAFIYKIAMFSTFAAPHADPIRFCVLGRDPFGEHFRQLEGKRLGEATIAIAYPHSTAEALRQCQIVFVSESEADNIGALASAAKTAGVMTISDMKGAARKGIMLELSVEDKRIAFEFNVEAARAANIALSSKVLRLARAVY
ncbi:MAG: YfiR family protein [Massilia sp.]